MKLFSLMSFFADIRRLRRPFPRLDRRPVQPFLQWATLLPGNWGTWGEMQLNSNRWQQENKSGQPTKAPKCQITFIISCRCCLALSKILDVPISLLLDLFIYWSLWFYIEDQAVTLPSVCLFLSTEEGRHLTIPFRTDLSLGVGSNNHTGPCGGACSV